MPIYEYECNACHNRLEVVQKISEAPLKTCEKCGTDTLEKLISQSAFHLKGGGWYSDLYSSSSKDKKSSDSSASSSASTSSESKSGKAEGKSEAA